MVGQEWIIDGSQPAIMPFETLKHFVSFKTEFYRAIYIAVYKKGFELAAEAFAQNPSTYLKLEDAALCYQHILKNMDCLPSRG